MQQPCLLTLLILNNNSSIKAKLTYILHGEFIKQKPPNGSPQPQSVVVVKTNEIKLQGWQSMAYNSEVFP